MRRGLLKALAFTAVAAVLLIATGPLVGIFAGMAGISRVPVWAYAGAYATLLVVATSAVRALEGKGVSIVPSRRRLREFTLGLAVGAVLFAMLALVRAASVDAEWTFAGLTTVVPAGAGLIVALLLLLPEELVFRGYAFQRLVSAVGAWPGILISAVLFGIYHVAGSGMWGIGAFFQFAMPALGGLVFGWAAVRTNGLALPIGLHLGGNWVQASLLSFRSQADASSPVTLWTARVPEIELGSLYAPELSAHFPFIATMILAMVAVRLASATVLERPSLERAD